MLAGATGLEPAASCVTGRRSNQLNYAHAISTSYRYRAFPKLPGNAVHFNGYLYAVIGGELGVFVQ